MPKNHVIVDEVKAKHEPIEIKVTQFVLASNEFMCTLGLNQMSY